MADEVMIEKALKTFAASVTAKMSQLTAGEPEDQLRAPLETFMGDVGRVLALKLVCTGETKLSGRVGKPDYAVHANKLLAGFIELKAPGVGANPKRFKGYNRDQWKRFQAMPNLIYCDGNEWGLYRSGEVVRPVVRLTGDVTTDGKKAINEKDAANVLGLLTDFLSWQPTIPCKNKNEIDLKGLAKMLAPLCGYLRDNVIEAMQNATSPLRQLAGEWRQLLFPDADDRKFADAYAQTVTFALLLARSEGAAPLTLESAEKTLAAGHTLLSRALQVLTDPHARAEIYESLDLLARVIGEVPPTALLGPEDPWLYFYEDFLAVYDAKLRKDAGVYYTPVEVVHAQVRLIDDLLCNKLGKALGFADRDVVTLDPAVGTGTYLLGVIEHALAKVEAQQGKGAVAGQAQALANNIYGFENMVGPFAVSELRVSRALQDKGAKPSSTGTNIYLTDTLESPHAQPPQQVMGWAQREFAEQHKRATKVKANVPVIVCLGNPPYDRHEAADDTNKARTGGWVRWGDDGKGTSAIFKDFLEPVLAAGHGVHVKNMYNLYVYFWRWALWKVFEHTTARGPGIVSFISASSYLDGDAFCGMREYMRRLGDEIWILDLGGEGRGSRKSDNVFAIQTPVTIAIIACYGKPDKNTPADAHFTRIEGTLSEKLRKLDAAQNFTRFTWETCPNDWQKPFRPHIKGKYFNWPLMTELMPWQHSGIECKRTWPIAPDVETLKRRWRVLLNAKDQGMMFRETGDRTVSGTYGVALTTMASSKPIFELPHNTSAPPIHLCGFRSFDRQNIIADARLISRPRPNLWHTHGPKQVYVTSMFNHPLGDGPALTACSNVPDRHHLRGSYGGKDVLPLYRNADASEENILPGLLALLEKKYKCQVTPGDVLAYVYGVLAQPAFTERYRAELETRELRVPITKKTALFNKVRETGAKLLWLHTYGERFVPRGKHRGLVPKGKARCVTAVPGDAAHYPETFEYNEPTQTLRVGKGEFRPVAPEVYRFEVSGLKVVQSWLKYRMKEGAGKKSSPLDDIRPEHWTSEFTTELLELLWVLEATVATYPEQAKLLKEVVKGPCFKADELPNVPDWAKKPPSHRTSIDLFGEEDEND